MKKLLVAGMVVAGVFGCTRPNPAVCCLDQADCDAAGINGVRECAAGLACVDHECVVPSCSMMGCAPAAPVCNITTDVCEGCMDSTQCSHFTDEPVCDVMSGACVGCVGSADCPADRPVCDTNACRACKLDSECASGACGDDGACVAESAIVYLDPAGTDAGTCTPTAPCRTIDFGQTRTSPLRAHIVMATGLYIQQIFVGASTTSAPHLFVHGGGSTLSSINDGPLASFQLSTTVRDITFDCSGTSGAQFAYGSAYVLERVRALNGTTGLYLGAPVTMHDIIVEGSIVGIGMYPGAELTLDGAIIKNTGTGITATSGGAPTVSLTNLLVFGSSSLALDLQYASGTITASTIADSGTDSGTGPRAVSCYYGVTFRSSIVWAPGSTPRAPIQGCNLISTIVGPTPVVGAVNTNPQFVNSQARDYHLAPGSPARDAVDSGPATDFEGDARPQGTRYDIGADEAVP